MPRSPSRDLSDRYIGRRGYFRNPDAIRRGKYALALIALFAAVGWAAVDVFQPAKAAYGHSHGPLTNPHAAFDDNCSACHVSYSIGNLRPLSVFNARERWHDLTCEKCHSGPPHHASATQQAKDEHALCSNCHHDHNGRSFSLVRLHDRDCNRCHTNLAEWHDPTKSLSGEDGGPYANAVTSFVTDHPEFRSLAADEQGAPKHKPRTLVFSHAVHMNPGQAYGPDGKEAMTVKKLHELGGDAAVARYAPGAAADAKIQLNCASCHTLDAGIGSESFTREKGTLTKGDPTRSLLPPRADGAYFLPTNFEVHCRSCHPLAANEGVNKTNDAKLILPRFDLPHRKQPKELREIIRAGYVQELLKTDLTPLPEPRAPGLPPEKAPKDDDRTARFRTEVDRLTGVAERLLLNGKDGCAKCHKTEPSAKGADGVGFTIKPVPDRTVWFAHAKFNHASHRGATCASCHPNTGGAAISPQDAEKPEPVQILGLESCRTCHSPTSTKVKLRHADGSETETFGGGVRSSCTDCHRYHHGDQPLQGRGAQSWFPQKPRDLADWLKGK